MASFFKFKGRWLKLETSSIYIRGTHPQSMQICANWTRGPLHWLGWVSGAVTISWLGKFIIAETNQKPLVPLLTKCLQTRIKFNTRLREHQKAVEQEQPKKSALAEHSLQSGHPISWESSVILHTSPGWRTRRLLEAWKINTCKSPLNRDDGMYLPQEYRALALLDKNWFYNNLCSVFY